MIGRLFSGKAPNLLARRACHSTLLRYVRQLLHLGRTVPPRSLYNGRFRVGAKTPQRVERPLGATRRIPWEVAT
jgi:hypothetical protein